MGTEQAWVKMLKEIERMSEDEIRALINHEVSTLRRKSYITRLHQRFSTLRRERERQQLIEGTLLL